MKLKKPSRFRTLAAIRQFLLRCLVAFRIMFRSKHLVVIYFTRDDLASLITDSTLATKEVTISYAGCLRHHSLTVIKQVASFIDDTELICDKATFDVEASEILNTEPPN